MWEDLVISESGARLFLQEPFLVPVNSTKVSHCTANFSEKSVLYNYLFCLQVGVFHQWPLINLQQINFIHCCSLLLQQWISMPAPRRGGWSPPHNFCSDCYNRVLSLSLSSHLYPLLCQGWPYSPHVIHIS